MTAALPQPADDPGRVTRMVELVRELAQARAEALRARTAIGRIEGELAELVGAGPPPVRLPSRVVVRSPQTAVTGEPAAPSPPDPATERAPRGERQRQVVALAKQGLGTAQIADRLGVAANIVSMALWRARKDGLLPKGRRP